MLVRASGAVLRWRAVCPAVLSGRWKDSDIWLLHLQLLSQDVEEDAQLQPLLAALALSTFIDALVPAQLATSFSWLLGVLVLCVPSQLSLALAGPSALLHKSAELPVPRAYAALPLPHACAAPLLASDAVVTHSLSCLLHFVSATLRFCSSLYFCCSSSTFSCRSCARSFDFFSWAFRCSYTLLCAPQSASSVLYFHHG